MDNQMMAQSTDMTTSLRLIEGMTEQMVVSSMSKIASFQAVVQTTLIPERDYGVIPGAGSKPTLLKSGAEKINMLFGLTPKYEFLSKIEDFNGGFFSFDILCTLTHNGVAVAQGVGNCNSREIKYRYNNVDRSKLAELGIPEDQAVRFIDRYGKERFRIEAPDPADKLNTILKMAKKRAYVDATLQVASLSNLFTQDLEDMDFGNASQATSASMTPEEAERIQVTFGKHKGKTLKAVWDEDPGYIDWMEQGQKTDPVIRQAIKTIRNAKNRAVEVPFDENLLEEEEFLNGLLTNG